MVTDLARDLLGEDADKYNVELASLWRIVGHWPRQTDEGRIRLAFEHRYNQNGTHKMTYLEIAKKLHCGDSSAHRFVKQAHQKLLLKKALWAKSL
jgi:hypothetical protein